MINDEGEGFNCKYLADIVWQQFNYDGEHECGQNIYILFKFWTEYII